MNPQVVILAPNFASIANGIEHAFQQLGWETTLFIFGRIRRSILPRRIIERAFDPHYQRAITRSFNQTLRAEVIPGLERNPPDLLLVLKGFPLEPDNQEYFQKARFPLALWTFDSVSRYPTQISLAPLASHTFYIDRGDVVDADARSTWLPLGYDERLYYPARDSQGIDILFVGSLGEHYARRRAYLRILSRSFLARKRRVALIGTRGTRLRDYALQLGSSVEWLAQGLPEPEFARCISSAKICINIMQDDGIEPINPTFFAIPGAGACQVAERRPHLSCWLRPREDYVEVEPDNFLETLQELLEDDHRRLSVAKRGAESVLSQHTYVHRVKTILSRLGMN
jgi:Glycosyl transferases group 1